MKKIIIYIMSISLLLFTFVGCTILTSTDATAYVQASLDSTYLNSNGGNSEILDLSSEELESAYQDNLQDNATFLANFFWIENITDEINERLSSLLSQIYSQAKYTVSEAEELPGDRFAVKVEVHPMDIINKTNNSINELQEKFDKKYDDVDIMSMGNVEYQEWFLQHDLDWALEILALIESNLDSIGYLEPITHEIEISLDDDGNYVLSDNYSDIDESILEYK